MKPAFPAVARLVRRIILTCIALLLLFSASVSSANPWNGRVVLQGFWWDYYNNNYPADWATYLARRGMIAVRADSLELSREDWYSILVAARGQGLP